MFVSSDFEYPELQLRGHSGFVLRTESPRERTAVGVVEAHETRNASLLYRQDSQRSLNAAAIEALVEAIRPDARWSDDR